LYAARRVLVLNSSFIPLADGSASVFVGRASGCEEFPCNVSRGSSCSYRNFSLFCTPCLIDSYSPDGRSCIACALGQHASRDQRSCTDKREYTIDCAGEWSACSTDCRREWTQTAAPSGTGAACPAEPRCATGEDNCPQDCAGEWSACSTDCRREWTQTAAPSGTGAACPAEPRCATGEDDCQSRFMLVLELVVVVCVLMCCCARFIKRCFSRQERAFKQLGDSDDTMELDAIERANVPDQSSSRGYTKVSKVTDEDGLESDTAPLVANASTT
jgi:hypothetical protein